MFWITELILTNIKSSGLAAPPVIRAIVAGILRIIFTFLGHTDLDTTRIYAERSLVMMRDAMSSFHLSQTEDEQPLWMGYEEEMAKLCGIR